MKKDYNLAVDSAKEVGARLVLGPVGLQAYTEASQDPNCVGLDSRVVYRFLGGDELWDKKRHVIIRMVQNYDPTVSKCSYLRLALSCGSQNICAQKLLAHILFVLSQ